MRALFSGLFVLCVAVILSLAAVEGGLRLARVYPSFSMSDRTIGYRLRPGARYRWADEGFSEGRISSAGWRDRDHSLSKPPGVTRIEVIGDSFVEALQVPQDSAFPALLERELNTRSTLGNRYEVIALGRSGMGTAEEYLTYKHWGAGYDPDVVAVLFVLNDFIDNTKAIDPSRDIRPFFVEQGDSIVLDTTFLATSGFRMRSRIDALKARSSLVAWATKAWNTMRQTRAIKRLDARMLRDEIPFYLDRRIPSDSIAAFRITRRIFKRFSDDVHRDGRRFILFVAGGAQQEVHAMRAAAGRNPAYEEDKPQHFLETCGAADGYEVVSLTPSFRVASTAGVGSLWCVSNGRYAHWNARGHALAAAEMARYLEGGFGATAGAR